MTSLRDRLVSHLTLKGYEFTAIDHGFTRVVPRTAYAETTLWVGPNGEMRSGDDLMESVPLSGVRWDHVIERESSKANRKGAGRDGQDAHSRA